MSTDLTEQIILAFCQDCTPGKTVDPADVAKEVARREGAGEETWRSRLTDVRRAAARLATAGRIDIYRKGKPADPSRFKGVYRLGARR